jgi:hypothetical protein
VLRSPPDNYTIATAMLPEFNFTWRSNVSLEKKFQVSAQPDFSPLVIDEPVSSSSFHGCSLTPGDWYWRVVTINARTQQVLFEPLGRRFSLIPPFPAPALESPRHGNLVRTNADHPVVFRWRRVAGAKSYHFKLYTAANQNDPIFVNFTEDTSQTVPTDTLAEGDYSWTVQAVAPASAVSTRQTGDIGTERFTLQKRFTLTLESPADGTVLPGRTALSQPTVFRWSTSEEVGRSRFVLSRNSNPLQGRPAVERLNPGQTVSLDRLEAGVWYWTVEAQTPEGIRINTGAPRRLQVLPVPTITLESPAAGTVLPGLTALRQPTIFRWSTDVEIGRSKFVLSRNPNPLRGRPAVEVEIPNRGRTVTVPPNRLGEGNWYWTVEAWTPDNIRLNDAVPRRLRVEAIPLLPAPGNRQQELGTQGELVFSWSAVTGANAYIFTLKRGGEEIVRNGPSPETGYILNVNDSNRLDEGTFVWQVEAVNRQNGTVEQRGRIGENTFIVDGIVIDKEKLVGEGEVEILDDE